MASIYIDAISFNYTITLIFIIIIVCIWASCQVVWVLKQKIIIKIINTYKNCGIVLPRINSSLHRRTISSANAYFKQLLYLFTSIRVIVFNYYYYYYYLVIYFLKLILNEYKNIYRSMVFIHSSVYIAYKQFNPL